MAEKGEENNSAIAAVVDKKTNDDDNDESATIKYKWPPLESDPQIFNDYMSSMGLSSTKYSFSELFGFDDDLLAFVPQPVMAIILNAEYTQSRTERPQGSPPSSDMYYMKQTTELDNACGIVACLHAIYNNNNEITLEPNSVLSTFREKVLPLSPEERAVALENYTSFKKEYRAVASKGQSSTSRPTKHHFTAFIYDNNNNLVELCGCKAGPLVIHPIDDDASTSSRNLLKDAATEIMRRVKAEEITQSVSVMALSSNVG
mmetsp:Transcript_187/g.166  ORF Transcript_187/g.166 Transcript_187/m.166 type:complete len:260 (-) Transcript_187:39-818(-)